MNPPPESFDALRRLLALKRHEMPPPGYFDRFSERVIARIEAQEHRLQPSWWEKMLGLLEIRPLVAAAGGAVALGLLAAGGSALWSVQPDPTASIAIAIPWVTLDSPMAADAATGAGPRTALDPMDASSSVNPVLVKHAPPGMFDPNRLSAQPVRYLVR
jgi:hypothetical protein